MKNIFSNSGTKLCLCNPIRVVVLVIGLLGNAPLLFAQAVIWKSVSRDLSYDFNDYPENEDGSGGPYGYYHSWGDWPDAGGENDTDLQSAIPFSSLANRLESEVQFPEKAPGTAGSGLNISGYASLMPNPPCYHARLKHRRVWATLPSPAPAINSTRISAIRVERRSGTAYPQEEVKIEKVDFVIPRGRITSEPYDLISGFKKVAAGGNEGSNEQINVDLLPVEVSWKAIDGFDNVDDHIDPWTKPIYGKRIFPDFKNPDDTEIRHKLEVIVKTSPALFGKAVFVKAFDVDDSTSESFDVDENGTAPVIDTIGIPGAGDDNLPDYLNTPKDGQFWTGSAWGGQTAQGTVDANGETKFIFRVGMQPGSNYRVVASVNDEAMYAGVQTSNPAAAKYLGPEANQTGGTAASPLLTVWRRLWVENDSMKAPGLHADGYLKNDLTSDVSSPTVKNSLIANGETIVQFLPVITDQSSLRNLENGTFILPPSGVYNQFIAFANNGPLGDGVTISGAHPEIQPGRPFRLYDDDDFGLNRAPLPRNDLIDDVVQNVYKTGFIEVVNAANFKGQDYNNDKYVEFHQNHPCVVHPLNPFAQRLVWEDAKNLSDSNLLWVANLVAGYQNESNRDFDPKTEEFDEGLTPAATRRYSIVYVEAVRDTIDGSFRNPSQNNSSLNDEIFKNMKLTAAHEIGHMPGTDPDIHHTEGHLMGDGGYGNEGQYFTPATLLRFRKTNKWQQP